MRPGTSPLLVRAVPDDVREALDARAAAAGTSVDQYVVDLLVREVARPSTAEVLARAARRVERARASAAPGSPAPDTAGPAAPEVSVESARTPAVTGAPSPHVIHLP